MNVVFVSYDGLTDPLGQSQILPYMCGLAAKGANIHIVSFEKKERFEKHKSIIDDIIFSNNLKWTPLSYTKKPPVLSTVYDLVRLRLAISRIIRLEKINIIHCRSYLTSLVGLWAKKKFGVKFIFDMRGFWADERVEGNIWNIHNPIFKEIYLFFKKQERKFFIESDAVVSLTNAAKSEILNWILDISDKKITVIPCCADVDFFNKSNFDNDTRNEIRESLNLSNDDLLVVYSGGLGTWYCLDEMLLMFKHIQARANSYFLILTAENKLIVDLAIKKNQIDPKRIIVKESSRNDMPKYLLAADLALFFILPSFSKTASSPTKQGEMMAMELPIICNSKVGDTAHVINKYKAGIVLNDFSESEFVNAASQIHTIFELDKSKIRSGAIEFYSLKSGVQSYWSIYNQLVN